MKHILMHWLPDFDGDSVDAAIEIDVAGREVRRVEIFPDGSFGFADQDRSVRGTQLGKLPMLEIPEINSNTPFQAKEIGHRVFEDYWERAVAASVP